MSVRLFFVFTLIPLIALSQQRYISSAIIAFSGGAYERTVKDVNTALEQEDVLTRQDRAKAYFYRAIAYKKLLQSNPQSEVLRSSPYLRAFNDFKLVQSLDLDEWAQRSADELPDLLSGLKQGAQTGLDRSNSSEIVRRRGYLENALAHINAARTITNDFDVTRLMGKIYFAFGDLARVENSGRDSTNYRAALSYLEDALRLNSGCLECISELLAISQQLNDADKIKQYTELLSSFED